MIEPATMQFLTGISRNNNKPWFEKNRSAYENAKQNILETSARLIAAIGKFDPPVLKISEKDTTFRINRDVRFSKNKAPYKSNMAIYINPDGKKANSPGYYFHVEPGKSFIAAGVWMPEPAMLAKIRQEIDYNLANWKKAIGKKSFTRSFPQGLSLEDSLVRPPKGYDTDNPAIKFLRLKSFIVTRAFSNKEITQNDMVKQLASHFKQAKPLIDFLRTAISE